MRSDPKMAAVAAVAAVLLAGCATQVNGSAARGAEPTGTTATTTESSSTRSSTSSSSTSSSAAASSSAESSSAATSTGTEDSSVPASTDPAASGTDVGQFGQVYTWTDGLEVTVAPGVAFTPSEYASAEPAAAFLSFTITITNKTGAPYDPTLFNVTAQSAGKEADSVYDSDNGLGGSPTTTVLDGRDATFAVGFGVADPADVVMEVSPGFDYDSVLFATEGAVAASAPPAAEPPVTGTAQAKFGQTYSWPAGLEVSVAAGTPFTPSESASADPASAYLSFTVTITNRTGQPYDPSLLYISAQSGSKEADQVFDSANGFVGLPSTGVLNGHQASFVIGFGVADAADVVMQVNPGPDYDGDAFFTS
ncbi:MAG: hypothetical protein ABWZ98_14670 [Nakamurella sp.]